MLDYDAPATVRSDPGAGHKHPPTPRLGADDVFSPAGGPEGEEGSWAMAEQALHGQLLTFEQVSEQVLATLAEQMPLGLWAITRSDGERQLF